MLSILDRYIFKKLVGAFTVVIVVFIGLLFFLELIVQVTKIEKDYTMELALTYSLYKTPSYIYEMLTMLFLISLLVALGGLARSNELTIIKASAGWSNLKIIFSLSKSLFFILLLIFSIGEYWAPYLFKQADIIKLEALNKNLSIAGQSQLWLRNENSVINVKDIVSEKELRNIQIFVSEDGMLYSWTNASHAKLVGDNRWRLQDAVIRKLIYPKNFELNHVDISNKNFFKKLEVVRIEKFNSHNIEIEIPINTEIIQNLNTEPRFLGIADIFTQIEFLEKNQINSKEYWLSFWLKIINPVIMFSLLFLVLPLISGNQRTINIGVRIFFGLVLGFIIYLTNLLLGNFSVVYELPPYLILLIVPSTILIISSYLLSRTR